MSLNDYLLEKRAAVQARSAAIEAGTAQPAQLKAHVRAEGRSGVRRLRIRDHQVVIVAGETGSGKSTQLPKICLEAGRGVDGMIGHTQPRRVAARTIAERIAV